MTVLLFKLYATIKRRDRIKDSNQHQDLTLIMFNVNSVPVLNSKALISSNMTTNRSITLSNTLLLGDGAVFKVTLVTIGEPGASQLLEHLTASKQAAILHPKTLQPISIQEVNQGVAANLNSYPASAIQVCEFLVAV
jgi:hypothetical protein